ncbi:MAG: alpha/beta fold hydrolase [Pirellulaceae bacterium]
MAGSLFFATFRTSLEVSTIMVASGICLPSPAALEADEVFEMGEGPSAVVFIHGLFGSPQHWRSIMADLAGRYRVLALQLPIDKQPGRRRTGIRTIEELCSHVDHLIGNLDLHRFVVCGNSLGGLVAMDMCLRHPERAAGLVLAGSAGLYERSLTNGARPRPTREFVRTTASDIIYNKRMITDRLLDEWHDAITDRDYVRFVLRLSRATRDRNVEAQLDKLKLPTLMIWGRNDAVTPPSVAEAFQRRIDGSELRFIDNCGHAPNLEQPAAFARMLQEFLPSCFS